MKTWLVLLVAWLVQGTAWAQKWEVGLADDQDNFYAFTVNDSNSLLGQYCYIELEKCIWIVATDIKCNPEATIPVLLSHDLGADTLTLACRGTIPAQGAERIYRYVIEDFTLADKAIRASRMVGFAIALKSGQFRVIRFDLEGAVAAVNDMRARTKAFIDRKTRKGTRDRLI